MKIDVRQIKLNARLKKDEYRAQVTANMRQKNLAQWCEYCGVNNPSEIDYENPQVKIEFYLCDPYYSLNLNKEEVRQEFYTILGPDVTDYYLNHTDDGGNTYRDLENGAIKTAIKSKAKGWIKKGKIDDLA